MKKKLTPDDLEAWEDFLVDQKNKPEKKSLSAEKSITPSLNEKAQTGSLSTNRKEVRHIKLDARLDMHGMTLEQARETLTQFLKKAQDKGHKNILVITGKGSISSPNTLRKQLPVWLQEDPFCGLVVSYTNPVKPEHGGAGAFYVVLRRKG